MLLKFTPSPTSFISQELLLLISDLKDFFAVVLVNNEMLTHHHFES